MDVHGVLKGVSAYRLVAWCPEVCLSLLACRNLVPPIPPLYSAHRGPDPIMDTIQDLDLAHDTKWGPDLRGDAISDLNLAIIRGGDGGTQL